MLRLKSRRKEHFRPLELNKQLSYEEFFFAKSEYKQE